MRKFMALLLCAVLAFGAAGCKGGGDADPSSSQATVLPEGTHPVEESVEELGTVTVLRQYIESQGTDNTVPDEGNVFLLCEFRIENTTDEDMHISTTLCFTGYADGVEVAPSIKALEARGAHSTLDSSMKAGQTMLGVVGFEVPADWKVFQVDFQPDAMRSDAISFAFAK